MNKIHLWRGRKKPNSVLGPRGIFRTTYLSLIVTPLSMRELVGFPLISLKIAKEIPTDTRISTKKRQDQGLLTYNIEW
jgi:hypothetical protein